MPERSSERAELADADRLLSPQAAADLCGITPRQLARLGAPFLDLGKRNRRYRRGDLLAWLEERRRPTRRAATP